MLLILFALRHFDMYVIDWISVALLPVFVLPQLYEGIFLSFTRIRFGFLYAILLHMLINFTASIPNIVMYAS